MTTLGRRLTVPIVAGAVFVIVLGAFVVDQVPKYLTVKRTVRVGTPVPTALFNLSLLPVPARAQACLLNVSIPSDVEQATFTSTALGRPGPPLTVTMSGPGGYRTVTRVPGGWGDGAVQTVPVKAPPQSLRGEFCVRNDGRRKIVLNATDRPAVPTQQVNGASTPTQMALSFDRSQARSLLDRLPEVFHRASYFTWLGTWPLYALALLLIIAVPLGLLYAFGSALRTDELNRRE